MSDGPDPTRPAGEPAAVPSADLRLDAEALRLLLDVSRRINAERDAAALPTAVVDSLVTVTRADRGFLVLKEGGGLRFALARDRKGRALELEKFRVSESVLKEVAETGETRLIDDAATSAAYNARLSIVNLSLRTILCVALKTDRGILGVIYVDSNAITRRFSERDVPLVEAFAAQAAVALERARLQEAERERDRMRQQLTLAAEIQHTFLPGTFPESPGLAGAVATVPAQQVGGDLYDVIRFPDGRTGLLVGDVSGKGVPAALFAARILSDVRYEALYHDDVAATLASVNDIVVRRSTRGMFVTLLYAVFHPATREVVWGNAGHLTPLARDAAGRVARWDEPTGLPLGIAAGQAYPVARRTLGAGETLVLLTDGFLDAVGPDGDRFGDERLVATVAGAPPDPVGLVRRLVEGVVAFTAHVPQADDLTCLAVAPA